MATNTSTLEILIKARDEATAKMKGLTGVLNGIGKAAVVGAKVFAAVGTAAATGMGVALKAAADAEAEMARVNATLKAMGPEAVKSKDRLLELASAAVKLGFDDETAAQSLAYLYQRTNDLTKAAELNQLAMDLARARGLELGEASKMIGMVMSGNARALKMYGIEIDDTLGPMAALADLQKKVTGNAQEYANTLTGKIAQLKIVWTNFLEDSGSELMGWAKGFADTLIYIVQDVLPRVMDYVQSLKEKVIEFVQNTLPYWQFLINAVTEVWRVIKEQLWPALQEPWVRQLAESVGVVLYAAFVSLVYILKWTIQIVATLIGWVQKVADFFNGALKDATYALADSIKWLAGKIGTVIDALKKMYEWAGKAIQKAKDAFSFGGSTKKVNDAVIAPSGDVVSTSPRDWLIATQNPLALAGGLGVAGGITINIGNVNGTDKDAASKLADMIATEIKYRMRL